MREYPTLGDRTIRDEPLLSCPSQPFGSNLRLWWKPHHTGFDFEACVFMAGSRMAIPAAAYMEHPETQAETLVRGTAYHDGVRHMWWGGEGEAGYVYYPPMQHLPALLAKLVELEVEHCNMVPSREGSTG